MAIYIITKERLKYLTIMAYLYHYPGSEGIGGKRGTISSSGTNLGDWVVGTRLRAPWGPLYDIPKGNRLTILNKLIQTNCIEVVAVDEDREYVGYKVTESGAAFLKRIPYRLIYYTSWYKHPSGWSNETQKYIYTDPVEFCESLKGQTPGCNCGTHLDKILEYK